MTEQYNQRNINQQGDTVEFASTVAVPDTALQASVQIAQIDDTLAASIVTLPRAADAGQNAEITVVNSAGANGVTVAAAAGDALVAAAGVTNPITGIWGSLTMKADPANNRWIVTGGTV